MRLPHDSRRRSGDQHRRRIRWRMVDAIPTVRRRIDTGARGGPARRMPAALLGATRQPLEPRRGSALDGGVLAAARRCQVSPSSRMLHRRCRPAPRNRPADAPLTAGVLAERTRREESSTTSRRPMVRRRGASSCLSKANLSASRRTSSRCFARVIEGSDGVDVRPLVV